MSVAAFKERNRANANWTSSAEEQLRIVCAEYKIIIEEQRRTINNLQNRIILIENIALDKSD